MPGTNPIRDYRSFGKVLLTFMGSAVVASDYFDDVQIIFYNFNDKASYMAGRNIASFPIPLAALETQLNEALDQVVNMSISDFINFIGTNFVSDPSAYAYGFEGFYDTVTSGDHRGERQLRQRYDPSGGAGRLNLRENNADFLTAQNDVLAAAYGSTEDLEFQLPAIQVMLESVPVRRASSGGSPEAESAASTVLRVHIFDSQATSHTTLQSLLQAATDQTVGLINAAALNFTAQRGAPLASAEAAAVTSVGGSSTTAASASADEARNELVTQLEAAIRRQLLELYPPTTTTTSGGASSTSVRDEIVRALDDSSESRRQFRIKGGFNRLKQFVMSTMPSIRYGEGSSGVISAKLSSMSDSALTTVNMLRQSRSPDTPAGARMSGVPLQIAPVECTLETFGCPLWNFGQQIFIDFGTGTTADAIYGVTGVEHQIEQGNFKTTVKLTPMGSYARYMSLLNNINSARTAIDGTRSDES